MTEIDIDTTEDSHFSHGVFQLPTQTEMPMPVGGPSAMRQGASCTSEAEPHIDGQHTTADDFPMLVWLRGDEPWFTQFDMDADSTMAALGIKRSRLTQIAGRDLRVGRVRVDRYIRPVFRSIDVAAYLDQTRATASHQKSSEAIQVASQAFNEQIERFQSTLDAISSNLTAQLNSVLGTLISESMSQNIATLHARVDSLEADMVNRISVMVQDTILKHMDPIKTQLIESSHATTSSFEHLQNNLELIKTQIDASQIITSERLQDLNGCITSLRSDVRACESSLEEVIKATQSDLAQLKDIILSDNDDETEKLQPKALLAWRASPRRRRMRPS